MEKERLMKYLHNPAELSVESLIELNSVIGNYPYFQTARLLLVKNYQLSENEHFESRLHYSAAYVTDRKILYYLLHPINALKDTGEDKSQENNAKAIKGSLKENISDVIESQVDFSHDSSFELIPEVAIDIRKEYGTGIMLDDDFRFSRKADLLQLEENAPVGEKVEDREHGDDRNRGGKEAEIRLSEDELLEFEGLEKQLTNEQASADEKIENDTREENESSAVSGESDKPVEIDLIDRFIRSDHRIIPKSDAVPEKDISTGSVQEHEGFITDTLANIYLKQGHYSKAIFAYEKLMLKYPEKSAYFADQIKMINNIINNQ